MSSQHLRNISVAEFQSFLELIKCECINSGHEKWTRTDLLRPVIIQTHIHPIPEFIIQNSLRILGYTKKKYFEILEFKKIVVRKSGNIFVLEDNPKKG